MARKRTLLIVCGGIETTHGVALARAMGLHVVVSDLNPDAPGMALADDRLIASTYDVGATVAAAKDYAARIRPIDGVICIGSDVPLTVAHVAATLGLPGISIESAELASDKLAMKRRFARHGVPIPWFAPVENAAHLAKIVAEQGRDLVLKPVDSRGSRGVQRLTHAADLDAAYAEAQRWSPTQRVMVERYLSGPQVSTEGMMLDGAGHIPGFSDRNYEYLDRFAPFFIENGGDLPSRLPQSVQDDVRAVTAEAGRALGVQNGNIKGDIVVHEGKAHVIELAARLSGGWFCTREIPLNTGVDFVGAVIRQALGECVDPADLAPKFQRPVVQRYAFPPPGRVTAVRGADAAAAMPGVIELIVSARPGDVIPPAISTGARAAMVLAGGATVDAAKAAAEAALAKLVIETAP